MPPINDYYLLAPEISMAGVGFLLIIIDLFVTRKVIVRGLAFLGLGLPLGFTISLSLCGGNETAFGGLLLVDQFAIFFKFLIIGVTGIVILSSQEAAGRFKQFQGEYYALLLLASTGLMLLPASGDLIMIYVALELSSLSSIALVSFFKDSRSIESGAKFLILSAVSSAMMLYGMALIYGLTGSTDLTSISAEIEASTLLSNPSLLIGVVLMIAGFGFKISAFPFHMWVPDVYQGAPTPITAFLAVASKAAGFGLILRVFYTAFPQVSLDWGMLFAVLAVGSMTVGNLVALFQTDIKRLLAYSAVAHAGYLLIGLAAVAVRVPGEEGLGPQSVLFYLGGYAFTTLGAFAVVIAVSHVIRSHSITDYAGLGKRSPILAGLFALCLVSLTGLPPTVGFWGKLYLFNSAVQADLLWLAIVGAINGVLSAYYYLRVVRVMYFDKPANEDRLGVSNMLALALFVTVGGVVLFGILPGYLLDFAVKATGGVLG